MLQIASTNTSIKKLLNTIIEGDAYDLFGLLPAQSVDLIITSPPYWGHRDYDLKHNWKLFNDIKRDLLPNLPSLIRRVCSGYALDLGVLRTQLV